MKFEIKDNSCTFVTSQTKRCVYNNKDNDGIFLCCFDRYYPQRYKPFKFLLLSHLYVVTVSWSRKEGERLSFLYSNFISMTKRMKFAANAQGAIKCTCPHETGGSLVSIRNNQVVTTSLQVAKFFRKNHFDVLRAIREIECSDNFQECNFAFSFYFRDLPNNAVKKEPMYYLTRDGFTFLAMGFTGKIAAKFKEEYINAFNEMERAISKNAGEGEILKLLKTILDDNKKRANVHGKEMQERYGVKPGGEIIPPFLIEGATLQENLRNVLAIVNNNTLEAQFYWADRVNTRKKLENLQHAVDEFTRKVKKIEDEI